MEVLRLFLKLRNEYILNRQQLPRFHLDGTGRNVPNQACQMETYHGGLQCCKHSWLLTDRDQDELIPKDKVDTYFLKWR